MNSLLLIRELASDVLVERLGWVLVHSLWQFTLLAFAAALAVRLLGRRRAAARYTVLVGAMAAIVVSPMATWFLQPEGAAIAEVASVPDAALEPMVTGALPDAARLETLDVEPADAALAVNLPAEELPANPALLAIPEVPVAAPAPLSWAESAERTLRPWLAWIVVGWSLGVVLCSLRPLLGWHALWRLRRVGVSPVGEEISAALRRVTGQLGLRRVVQVLQSTLVQTPLLVGYFRPAILLPVGLATGLPIAQLEAILAHELAHVRRHDFVVNLLQTLVETLCFYHPAVWWLSRQIRVEREHCCDDLVVGLLGNRVEYGRALLAVEELRGTSSVLALGMADGVLLSRVRRLFGGGSDRVVDRWPAALLSLAGVGFVLVLGLVWHRAAQDDDDVSQAAIARLPGDITIELVGVGFHPSADKAWWKPDGSPIERPRDLRGGGEMIPASDRNREFLLEVRGMTPEQWFETRFGKRGGAATFDFEGLRRSEMAAGPYSGRTTNLKVRVATDPFGPTLIIDKNGTSSSGPEVPYELKALYARFVPKRVETFGGSTDLFVQNNGEKDQQISDVARVDLVAIDLDGQRHQPNSHGSRVGELGWGFTGLLPDRIDHFEYRLQPYRHFVTFENISLEPGRKTAVKVSVESLPQPVIAKLPGDIAVELVGVGSHPSKDKPWWKPDGRPLEPQPTLEGGFSVMSGSPEQAQCREFLIHIRGLPQDHSVHTDYGPVSAATGSSWSNGIWVGEHGAGPFKTPTARVRVGLTAEPYGPVVIFHRSGRLAEGTKIPEELLSFYGRVVPLRVEEKEGRTELVVESEPYNELHKLAAWQLSAVDVDGERVRSSSEWAPATGGRHIGFKLALQRLDHFEFRLRPYRHWVTFENVSLEPGRTTEVKVSTESLPAPVRAVGTLPDGSELELVAVGDPLILRSREDEDRFFEGHVKGGEIFPQTWWKPDGTPLAGHPSADQQGYNASFEGCRQFLLRLRRTDGSADPSVGLLVAPQPEKLVGGPFSPVTAESPLESELPWIAGPFADRETVDLRVGIADGPATVWKIGVDGRLLNDPVVPAALRELQAGIEVDKVEPRDGESRLWLKRPATLTRLATFSLAAIDKEGKEHGLSVELFNSREQDRVRAGGATPWTFRLPIDQVDHFEYRLRPYRHWVKFKGVSLEAGKESDVKVSVETVQATADFPRPRPEDVRGLDLSRAAVRHYSEATRLSPEQQTPELLVAPGSDPFDSWRRPKNVFLMPLAENFWLKYPAGSGHFYINHRPDGTWQHERMYGPIEGDPFELLKLEELFREQLKPGATGGDPRYRLTLMFRTGEPELVRRAWRLIEPELIVETSGPDAGDPVAGSAVRYTEQDPWRFERIESLGRVREALRDEAEAFRRPELTDVAARMREIVAAAEAAIDATNDAVADSAYESVTYLQPGLQAKIPEALWGPPLDGLRLGLVPSDGIDWSNWQQLPTDKPLPTSITALSGDELQYLVVVENVSDREIKLSGYVVGQEMARGLEMLDQNGRPVDIENLHASTLHIRSYWRLKPGERQLLTMPAVNLTSAPVDPAERRLGYSVKAVPGHHTLRCTIRFGNLDNERHRYVPGKSEWIGELSTGTQKITVVERVLDGGETPAADQSVSLVDAVRDFNAENKQRGRGQEQPPLTEEEVIAAIQRSDWKRDAKDVSEREFAAFKAVAKTRRLPEGVKLEVLTGVQSDAFTTSRLWSIRLIMPALERAGTVGFSIRHTVLGEEKIDPEQVAWGKPDADGLSLGLFLSPRKAQYQIGERVQLRLFVRNEGRKAIDDLTFMNITWPVIEDFTVTDQTGARVAVRNGHEEWSGLPWIAGAIKSGLEAGDAYALRVPFEIGLGGEVDKPVGRILDAKPGQTLRLRVRAANGSERIRAADEPTPESGEVTFSVQTQTAAVDDAKNPSNRPAALPRATLTGRFVYDGEAPPRKDLWPQFAEIDATQRQPPGPDGRFSGVEATYREFLKQNIRPSMLDSSLLVDETGGIANVVVWVTSQEIPWTPPEDLAQRPVTIRLKDGHFSPPMTVAMVGQPVVVENLDPVPFGIHAMFRKNSDFNPLLRPGTDVEPFHWTGAAAEPFPAHYRCDQGPWADGWLFVAANSYVAVSRADGTFTLPDLPPGEWEFRVWHERRGYLQHWPKGVFRRVIEPGRNDLGEIRLKPELLAER